MTWENKITLRYGFQKTFKFIWAGLWPGGLPQE